MVVELASQARLVDIPTTQHLWCIIKWLRMATIITITTKEYAVIVTTLTRIDKLVRFTNFEVDIIFRYSVYGYYITTF